MSEDTETTEEVGQEEGETQASEAGDDDAVEQEVKDLEEDPPDNLEEWPDGAAKYKTFGGPEGDSGYEDGPTSALGSSNVRHHEDGTVTVDGEEVDNPDDYKGEPIPGGPTDPDAQKLAGDKAGDDDEGSAEDSSEEEDQE